jgi:hypothetical protein
MSSRAVRTESPSKRGRPNDVDAPFPALLERYRQYIKQLDLDEGRQRELLEAIWLIVNALVEHSFNATGAPTTASPPKVSSARCKK